VTWLAASTHEGEEDIVLEAHVKARRINPELRLILAPRHPHRADQIAEMIAGKGLDCARRSTGDSHAASVLLADTMGEMPNWYRQAGRVFIAGSLTDRRGHTPYEPAYFGCALIHGPDTGNFASAYERLAQNNAAICVENADQLAEALASLDAESAQEKAGIAAQNALRAVTNIDGLVSDLVAQLPE
jgi:3-deoxy-D-manno-octulosonic-acid transferase